MANDAVLRNLAVIGEAVKSLPDDFKHEHAGTPWPSIAGLRNEVVHECFWVDPDMIRDIVDNQLAPLLDDIGSAPHGGLVPRSDPRSRIPHRTGPLTGED